MTDIIDYLVFHEDDIAYGINDFGDLRQAFEELVGREPQKTPDEILVTQ